MSHFYGTDNIDGNNFLKALWQMAIRRISPLTHRLPFPFRKARKNDNTAYFNMDTMNYDPDYEAKKPCPPDVCSKTGYEVAEVTLPLEILPNACVGEIETDCCGEPRVTCECSPCGNSCRLVITQRIKIKIPYSVGIKALTGCSHINCSGPGRCLGVNEEE